MPGNGRLNSVFGYIYLIPKEEYKYNLRSKPLCIEYFNDMVYEVVVNDVTIL